MIMMIIILAVSCLFVYAFRRGGDAIRYDNRSLIVVVFFYLNLFQCTHCTRHMLAHLSPFNGLTAHAKIKIKILYLFLLLFFFLSFFLPLER